MDRIQIKDLFDLTHTMAVDYLLRFQYPWEALEGIGKMIYELIDQLPENEYIQYAPDVFIHKSVKIASNVSLTGPSIIGAGTEIRPGAFVRGSVLVGEGAVIGNSCELKNCILFDGVQTPHFNYVGDSILGYMAHMGAGAVTSNVKGDKHEVVVHGERDYKTGRMKFGAMLGDYAEVGCNTVLNPGTILGKNTQVYPLSSVRGVVPESSIYKGSRGVVQKDI